MEPAVPYEINDGKNLIAPLQFPIILKFSNSIIITLNLSILYKFLDRTHVN